MASTGGLHQSSNIKSMRHETAETTVVNPNNKMRPTDDQDNKGPNQDQKGSPNISPSANDQPLGRLDNVNTPGAIAEQVALEHKNDASFAPLKDDSHHASFLDRASDKLHEASDELHKSSFLNKASDKLHEFEAKASDMMHHKQSTSEQASSALSAASDRLNAPAKSHAEFPTETAVYLDRHKNESTGLDISRLSSAHEIPASPSSSSSQQQVSGGSFFGGLIDSIKGAAVTVGHALHLDGVNQAPASDSSSHTAPHAEFPSEVAVFLNKHSEPITQDISTMDSEIVIEKHPEVSNAWEVRELDAPSTMHALQTAPAAESMMGKLHELMNAPSAHKEFGSDLSVLLEHNNQLAANDSNSTQSA